MTHGIFSALTVSVLLASAVAATSTMRGDNTPIDKRPRTKSIMPNLGGCSDAPACGDVMATIDGTHAKSNGGCQCGGCCCAGASDTGCQFQCVEFAQRYFHQQYNIQKIWPVNFASEMCDKWVQLLAGFFAPGNIHMSEVVSMCYCSYPSGVHHTSNPVHGDLVVFGWAPDGHVAVVNRTEGSTLHVVEQNDSPTGVNTYDISQAKCFLSAQ